MADQIADPVFGDRLQQLIDAADHLAVQDGAMHVGHADPVQLLEFGDVRDFFEDDLEGADRLVAKSLQFLHLYQATFPDDPHPVGDPLHLRQDVGRKEHGHPVVLEFVQEPVHLLLHQRVEPGSRLIEDHKFRSVHKRLDQAEFLAVPFGKVADPAGQIEVESLREPLGQGVSSLPPQIADVGQEVTGGHTGIELHLPRQIPDPAPDGRIARRAAQHLHRSLLRADQVDQHADGGGLAGAVGAQVSEDLPGPHLEIELCDPPGLSVILGHLRQTNGNRQFVTSNLG